MLVPAALERQVTEAVARTLRCGVLVEGANGPTTPGGERVLAERGIPVVPDILANAGGVVVSYYEWYQNVHKETWDAARVERAMEQTLVPIVRAMRKSAKTPRAFCYHRAFDALAAAL